MAWYRKASQLCDRGGRKHPRTLLPRNAGWRSWLIALGALCLLGALDQPAGAQTCPYSEPTVSASFNFDQYTQGQLFTLNTCATTPYLTPNAPAWANVITQASNFVDCKATTSVMTPQFALCYYSGPAGTVPCELAADGATATCTCYVIPAGQAYSVDINAISDLTVYTNTTAGTGGCGQDGSGCTDPNSAPVCTAINDGMLIPGATLISVFSTYLADFPSGTFTVPFTVGPQTSCPTPPNPNTLYAGCMTAPCTLTDSYDSLPPAGTGLQLAQCTCPTFTGPFQTGVAAPGQCTLEPDSSGPLVWSASYTPPTTPPTQQIAAIMTKLDSLVLSGDLTAGGAQSLGAKAEAAFMIIQKHDNPAGKNILNAMLNDVSALLKSKRISSNTASILSGAISRVIASL